MNRREFVGAALGGIGLVTAVANQGVTLDAQTPFLRRNIYCLTEKSPQVIAYRKGVAVMKKRPVSDPTSCLAQANIHGAFSPPPGAIANVCQHGNHFFLSWHRMYLHFFERIVRAASGDKTFALPYWGYSPTGARNLPAPFRVPAAATNTLFVSQRRATINGGADLTASSVDAGTALAFIPFNSFSSSLEGTPHGVVHGGVGGLGGWMSAFETAGQDPIFWLHHCNIDRLWEVWLAAGGGRVNPTANASWMNTTFNFYDEKGATVSMKGADVVNTAKQLNYRYEAPRCSLFIDSRLWTLHTRIKPWDPVILKVVDGIHVRAARAAAQPIVQAQRAVPLAGARSEIKLPVDAVGRKALAGLPKDPASGRQISLVLEDIKMDNEAEVYYEVYINAPAGVPLDYTSPHYVGNLDFFGPSPKATSQHGPMSRRFDLLPAWARLTAAKRWSDDEIRVTFVPRGFTEKDDPSQALANRSQATIGQVLVRIE